MFLITWNWGLTNTKKGSHRLDNEMFGTQDYRPNLQFAHEIRIMFRLSIYPI